MFTQNQFAYQNKKKMLPLEGVLVLEFCQFMAGPSAGLKLADLGARVRLCERHPVIAAMLEAGMDAARNSGDSWLVERVSRMQLHKGDACLLPPEQLVDVDVIYLDPMFPARTKAAAVKKEMALFQYLLHDSSGDGEATLHWALQQQVARVVVKRPDSSS